MSFFQKKKQASPEEQSTKLPTIQPETQDKRRNRAQDRAGSTNESEQLPAEELEPRVILVARTLNISRQFGATTLVTFLLGFIALMVLHGVLPNKPLLFSVNMS
jgi:hypothetical protein